MFLIIPSDAKIVSIIKVYGIQIFVMFTWITDLYIMKFEKS